MAFLTVSLEMSGRRAVVIGAGSVALRKVRNLLECGAGVRLVAPRACDELARMAADGVLEWRPAPYTAADFEQCFLAVAATDDPALNRRIADDARSQGILVNTASPNDAGDTLFPALLKRDRLEVAVSSSGLCPAYAVAVRDLLAEIIGPEFGPALTEAAALREKLLTDPEGTPYNIEDLRTHVQRLVRAIAARNRDTAP